MTKKERSLFNNQITPEELQKKLRELDKFMQNKKDENDNNPDNNSPNIKKLYDAAQEVIEALKKLSQSVEKAQVKEKGQESDHKDKEQNKQNFDKQDFGRVKDVIDNVLSPLNQFMSEDKKEKELGEEKQKEEEKKKQISAGRENDDLEKKKQEELDEQKRKKELEKDEEAQKKEKEEKTLKKSLETMMEIMGQILEHEKKLQREALGKERSQDLGENIIRSFEKTLPALKGIGGKTESKESELKLNSELKDIVNFFKEGKIKMVETSGEEQSKKPDANHNNQGKGYTRN